MNRNSLIRTLWICLVLATSGFGQQPKMASAAKHPDYVPDENTAVQIAEVVLVRAFGRERVEAQKPFVARLQTKDVWLVAGNVRGTGSTGGNMGVWIYKNSACVGIMESMK